MTYNNILILTGAGVSAESGLDTFRDAGGVWARYDYREVATPEGFAKNPALVHEFYNMRRASLKNVQPNAAHKALGRLEAEMKAAGRSVFLVTQNVDNLHEAGGSEKILHMHGELTKIRCDHCGAVLDWADDLSTETACPACSRQGGLRPHIVWFGEMPMGMDEIYEGLAASDLFVSIGTSGSVYPAAGLVGEARAMGLPAIELNLEKSENHQQFTEGFYGPASEVVPAWVDRILSA